MVGASGVLVSTVVEKERVGPWFPTGSAPSVCVADRFTTPSGNIADDVILHVPSTATVFSPIFVSALPSNPLGSLSRSANSVTVAPGSPVPVTVGVAPESGIGLTSGNRGAVVSIVKSVCEPGLTSPARST